MSELVRWKDARAIFGLLSEVQQLGSSALAWRTHLLQGLLPLIGAQVGLAAEAVEGNLLDASRHQGPVDLGWATAGDQQVWLSACTRTELDLDPSDEPIAKLRKRTFARARPELVDGMRWRNSKMANDHYRPAALGDYLLSAIWVPSRGISHFMLLIKPAGGSFRERERDLVAHTHRELGALWQRESELALPPHLRRTLTLLEEGFAEKEVADQLQLSAHTVRDYCKALHRRFRVHNRSALLAATRYLPRAPATVFPAVHLSPLRKERKGRAS